MGNFPNDTAKAYLQGSLLSFTFSTERLHPGAQVVHIGTGVHSLMVIIGSDEYHTSPLLFRTVLSNGKQFDAVLLGNVELSQKYNVRISILDSSFIEGWVNGVNQFTLSTGSAMVKNDFSTYVIGSNARTSGFNGQVSDFVTRSQKEIVYEDPFINLLRVLGSIGVSIIIFMSLFRIAWWFIRGSNLWSMSSNVEGTRAISMFRLKNSYIGFILIAVGLALFATASTPNNEKGPKSGYQHIVLPSSPPGITRGIQLSSESMAFTKASSVSLEISARVKIDSYTNIKKGKIVFIVNDWTGSSGGSIILTPKGELLGAIGVQNSLPIFADFEKRAPVNTWLDLTMEVTRNRSFRLIVNGRVVSSEQYVGAYLNSAPSNFIIGSSGSPRFLGTIANATETVTLFRSPSQDVLHFVPTEENIFAGLVLGLGIVILSERFLSRLIPISMGAKRPLVLIALGTTAILTLFNVLVDAIHFQGMGSSSLARNSWLYPSNARFMDFYQVFAVLKSGRPYIHQLSSYPPFGYLILSPIAWMDQIPAFYTVLSLFAGFLVWWSLRVFGPPLHSIEKFLLLVVIGLSLPVSFVIDRGNTDMLNFILLVLGAAAIAKSRKNLAAIFFGLLIATKIYPLLYLLTYLKRREWKSIFIGLAVAAGISLFGFLIFEGSLVQNIEGLKRGLSSLQDFFSANSDYSTFYHSSLPAWLQAFGYALNGEHGLNSVSRFISGFQIPVEILSAIVLAWFIDRFNEPLWRIISLITLWILLIPGVTFYYELIYLFVPLALFVQHAEISKRTLWISVLFGVCLAPKAYFYLGNSNIDVSVLLSAPLLVALTVLIIRDGIDERRNNLINANLGNGEIDRRIAILP